MISVVKSIAYTTAATVLRPSFVSRFRPYSLPILMYHGVVDELPAIPDPCLIPTAEFRKQMQYLASRFNVVPLEQGIRRLQSKAGSRPPVVVTFDDGYQNNLDLALPILEQYGIPATIFLTTGYIGTSQTIWTGLLQQAFAESDLPALRWRGREWDMTSVHSKTDCMRQIKAELKRQPQNALMETVADIVHNLTGRRQLPIERSSPYRMLDIRSAHRLAASDCIDLGAHTKNHYILSQIDRSAQAFEIRSSLDDVQAITSTPCRTFAYPNGLPDDYNEDTLDILRDCGVSCAVTTVRQRCRRSSFSRLLLPRISIDGRASLSSFKVNVMDIKGLFSRKP